MDLLVTNDRLTKSSLSLLALSLSLALGLSGCQDKTTPTTPSPKSSAAPVTVETMLVTPREVAGTVSTSGTVKARRQAVLSTRLAGRITYLAAEEGDVLGRGDLVAEIDASDVAARTRQAEAGQEAAQAALHQSEAARRQAEEGVSQAQAQVRALKEQLEEARARLEVAKQDNGRYQLLASEGAIARQDADHASSELKVARSRYSALQSQIEAAQIAVGQARASVAQAQSAVATSSANIAVAAAGVESSATDLTYSKVHAPFRGVVVEKTAYQGELNTPGRPLLKLQDLDSLEVAITVPEASLEQIHGNAVFSAEAPGLSQNLKLKVRQIVASTDPSSRTVEVRLGLSEPPRSLFPGSYVRVQIPGAKRRQILIPQAAVVNRGQLEGVFVVESGVARLRLLQLAAPENELREVLSGLSGTETIVSRPSEALTDGREVQTR